MKCRNSSLRPLHQILLSHEFRPVLLLLGGKAKDQILVELNAEYESRIAICLTETTPRKSIKEMPKR